MELAFVKAEDSGWRGRGAPRRKVPQEILDVLQHAARTGEVGVIDTREDNDTDVREALAALRAGGRQLGRRVTIQHDPDSYCIRFRVGDPL